MKHSKNKYKIKNNFIVDGLIEIFESESLNVKAIKELYKFINKLILIGIIYMFIIFSLQKYPYLCVVFIFTFVTFILLYTYKKAGSIFYKYSQNLGGKPIRLIELNKNKGDFRNNRLNAKLIRGSELKLVKKILKINRINNVECIQEIQRSILQDKYRDKNIEVGEFIRNIISLYMIPITFGIISIYTSAKLDVGIEEYIVNIGTIILISLIILTVILVLYIIYKVRNFSITDRYTYKRLPQILTQIILEKQRNK